MKQRARSRLVALNKADKKPLTQQQAAPRIGLSQRQVRRLPAKLRGQGDRAVIHGVRGRANRTFLLGGDRARALDVLAIAPGRQLQRRGVIGKIQSRPRFRRHIGAVKLVEAGEEEPHSFQTVRNSR